MPAPAAERSRSPRSDRADRAKSPQAKFDSKLELGSWILFRDSPKRRWAEAYPALISKVVSALQKTDVRCSIIIPNLLTLRHGFGGNHFKEVNDVEMKNIKAYPGSDMSQLKEQLLLAIKNDRAERARRLKVKVERRAMDDASALPIALKLERREKKASDDSIINASDNSIICRDGHEVEGNSLKFDVMKNKGVPLEKGDLLRTNGALPEGASQAGKMDDVTAQRVEDVQPGELKDEDLYTKKVGKMDRQRLEDYVRSAAHAFGRQSMLTRQELTTATTMVELKLTSDEMAEGLAVLEEENKVFISNDLIFAI